MTVRKPRVRQGLVKYPGGTTWFYLVRFRGEIRRGDTGCTSHDAAVAWLKKERDSWGLEEQGLRYELPSTPAQILRDWEEVQSPAVGAKHLGQMKTTILVHLAEIKDRPLAQITLLDLEQVRARVLAMPITYHRDGRVTATCPRTVGGANSIFKMLSALWLWAKNRDYPVGDMPLIKRLQVQEVVAPVVWPELVPAFLCAVDFVPVRLGQDGKRVPYRPSFPTPRPEDQRLAIRLQLLLGLREDEALGFDWLWMDWRQGVYRPGKTKNRKTREIPVEPDLLARIKKRWEAHGKPSSGLAMPEASGAAHRPNFTAKTVRAAGIAVGLVGLHPHRLRATFATTLWEIGTPLSQIQQMMGHADPETTLGYIVQRPKDQAEAVRKMAAAMGIESSATTVPPKKQKSS